VSWIDLVLILVIGASVLAGFSAGFTESLPRMSSITSVPALLRI